jgi:uracil-DNA glycosylase
VDSTKKLRSLLDEVSACRICEADLPLGPRPILRASTKASILIAGHAPGIKVHESGIPWDDASGQRLREWMGIDNATFYDEHTVAIVPMGFCYPGRGKSGDLPPRPECRAAWHHRLLPLLTNVKLIIAVGEHAQRYHLADRYRGSVTETVKAFREYDNVIPIPHPSPRNQPWLAANPHFQNELVPELQARIRTAVQQIS